METKLKIASVLFLIYAVPLFGMDNDKKPYQPTEFDMMTIYPAFKQHCTPRNIATTAAIALALPYMTQPVVYATSAALLFFGVISPIALYAMTRPSEWRRNKYLKEQAARQPTQTD